jgi:methyltransferase (TIGR00027 family)
LGVARIRAAETSRKEPLFTDSYAAKFLRAAPPLEPVPESDQAQAVNDRLSFHVVIRTRFYDEYLRAATVDGCRQVVLLAAGLDARAHRLAWPTGVHVFELDLPSVLSFKAEVLQDERDADGSTRTYVPVDLREDWATALITAGFDPGRRTAWLAEGLLIYLNADEAATLLATVTSMSAPGSQLATEGSQARSGPAPELGRAAQLWRGGLGQSPEPWLADRGWRCTSESLSSVAARLGRSTGTNSGSGFVVATRSGPSRCESNRWGSHRV